MQLTITIEQQSYARHAAEQEASPAELARKLAEDIQLALKPCLQRVAEGMCTNTLAQMDGAVFNVALADDYTQHGWREVYTALVEGTPLASAKSATQEAVIRALQEIAADVACGWLTPESVRSHLGRLDRIATQYRCLEYYERIAGLVGTALWPSPPPQAMRAN